MAGSSKLIPISYFSPKQSIRLNAYADTIIYEPDGRRQILRAIRFGGYPEMVRALADALYAGADLEATIMAKTSASAIRTGKKKMSAMSAVTMVSPTPPRFLSSVADGLCIIPHPPYCGSERYTEPL